MLSARTPVTDRGLVAPGLSRVLKSTSARLALAAFLVFNLNLRSISSADTFPTRYLPIALLQGRGFNLDGFDFLRDSSYPAPEGDNSGSPYYLQLRRGHWLSTYPVMPAILATPVYALPVALGLTNGPTRLTDGYSRTEIVGTLLSKIAASAASAAAVALVYLALLRLTGRRAAFWIAVLFAFATSTWSVSSQGAWQTSYSGPLLAGAALYFLLARDMARRRHAVGAGACLALAVACRPTAGIFALLLTAYAFRHHRRDFWAFLACPAVVGILLVAYNFFFFGTILGGYTGKYVAAFVFTLPQVAVGTYGLLLSANRGMLVLSPVLLVSFAGLIHVLLRRDDPLLLHLALGILATILFYSTFTAWYGTFSFSYRYLVDLVPLLALFVPRVSAWFVGSPWRRRGMATLAAYSVGVQIVGSFFYPCGWYRSPVRDPAALSRIFSWRDMEVVQCLRSGPVYPDGLRLFRQETTRHPEPTNDR